MLRKLSARIGQKGSRLAWLASNQLSAPSWVAVVQRRADRRTDSPNAFSLTQAYVPVLNTSPFQSFSTSSTKSPNPPKLTTPEEIKRATEYKKEMIEALENHGGRSLPVETVVKIVDAVQELGVPLDSDEYMLLFEVLSTRDEHGKAGRLFDALMSGAMNVTISPEAKTSFYNARLGYLRGVRLQEGNRIAQKMKVGKVAFNLTTLTLLIKCNKFSASDAEAWLAEMEKYLPAPYPIEAFQFALEAYEKGGELDKCMNLFRRIQSQGYKVNTACYTAVIGAYCTKGLVDEAQALLKEMQKTNLMPNSFTYTKLIQGYSVASKDVDPSEGIKFFKLMKTKNLRVLKITYAYCLSCCAKSGDWKLACELLGEMRFFGHDLTMSNFGDAIAACEKAGEQEAVNRLEQDLKQLTEQGYWRRDMSKGGGARGRAGGSGQAGRPGSRPAYRGGQGGAGQARRGGQQRAGSPKQPDNRAGRRSFSGWTRAVAPSPLSPSPPPSPMLTPPLLWSFSRTFASGQLDAGDDKTVSALSEHQAVAKAMEAKVKAARAAATLAQAEAEAAEQALKVARARAELLQEVKETFSAKGKAGKDKKEGKRALKTTGLEALPYKDLQARCKSLQLQAVGKKSQLVSRLWGHFKNDKQALAKFLAQVPQGSSSTEVEYYNKFSKLKKAVQTRASRRMAAKERKLRGAENAASEDQAAVPAEARNISGVGGIIVNRANPTDEWGLVVSESRSFWRLKSGRIAKKATLGTKWVWASSLEKEPLDADKSATAASSEKLIFRNLTKGKAEGKEGKRVLRAWSPEWRTQEQELFKRKQALGVAGGGVDKEKTDLGYALNAILSEGLNAEWVLSRLRRGHLSPASKESKGLRELFTGCLAALSPVHLPAQSLWAPSWLLQSKRKSPAQSDLQHCHTTGNVTKDPKAQQKLYTMVQKGMWRHAQAGRAPRSQVALNLLNEMKRYKLNPTAIDLLHCLRVFMLDRDWVMVKCWTKEILEKQGIPIPESLLIHVLGTSVCSNEIDLALELVPFLKQRKIQLSTGATNALLMAYCNDGRRKHEVQELFEKMMLEETVDHESFRLLACFTAPEIFWGLQSLEIAKAPQSVRRARLETRTHLLRKIMWLLRFAKFKPHPAESKEVAADDGKESKPEEDKEQVDFSPEDYQPAWNCVNMDSTLRDIILEFVNEADEERVALERQRLCELQTMSHKQLREIEPDTDLDTEEALRIIPKSLVEVVDDMFDEDPVSDEDLAASDSENDVAIRPGLDQQTLDKLDAAEDSMRRAEEAIAQMHRAEIRRGNVLAKKIRQVRLLVDVLVVVEEGQQESLFPLASLDYVELDESQANVEICFDDFESIAAAKVDSSSLIDEESDASVASASAV